MLKGVSPGFVGEAEIRPYELDVGNSAERRKIMTVYLNRKEFTTEASALTVVRLLELNDMPRKGIAVAVNGRVVPKTAWESALLADGDKITVITAVCGG